MIKIPRADIIVAAGLFMAAAGLRIAFVLEAYDAAFFDLNTQQGTDMASYIAWAGKIAGGDVVGGGVFSQAPLHPYILGALLWYSGGSLLSACLFQALMGALSCVLVYAAARRIFSRPFAVLAGGLLALYEASIFFSAFALATTLAVLCSSIVLLLVLLAWTSGSRALWGMLGFAVGVASLARPNFMLLGITIVAVFVAVSRWGGGQPVGCSQKRSWGLVGLFILFFCLAILPVTIRNAAVSGRFAPVSANAMVTYRLANSYDSLVYNHLVCTKKELMPVYSGAFWLHQMRKAVGFWIGYEIPQNADMYLCRRYSTVLSLPLVPFIVIGPLGIAGLLLGIRRFKEFCPVYVPALTWYASIIPFYVASRLRVPVVPALCLFSALALREFIDTCRRKRWLPAACLALAVGLLALGTHALRVSDSAAGVIRIMRVGALSNLSRAMIKRGDNTSAIGLLRESVGIRPGQPAVHLRLGALLAAEGDDDEAIRHLETAIRLDPDNPEAYRIMDLVHLRLKNDPGTARDWLEKAKSP